MPNDASEAECLGHEPDDRGELVRRHTVGIRTVFERGRAAYGDISLDFADFAAAVVSAKLRHTNRAAALNDARFASGLSRLQAPDLYLAIACDRGIDCAWEVLHDRFLPRLRRIMRRRGVPDREIDQVLADLPGDLVAPPPGGGAATRIGTYDGTGKLFYWLVTVVFRRLADRARRSGGEARGETGDDRSNDEPARGGNPAEDPADAASRRETCQRIREAVRSAWQRLTPRHLVVLRFKFLTRHRQKDVARLLGVSEALVSHLLSEAIECTRVAVVRQLGEGSPDPALGADRLWDVLRAALEAGTVGAEDPARNRDLPDVEPNDDDRS